jgi:hypothetical protein
MEANEIRTVIAGLDHDEWLKVRECANKVRTVVNAYGEAGILALAAIGLELISLGEEGQV